MSKRCSMCRRTAASSTAWGTRTALSVQSRSGRGAAARGPSRQAGGERQVVPAVPLPAFLEAFFFDHQERLAQRVDQ